MNQFVLPEKHDSNEPSLIDRARLPAIDYSSPVRSLTHAILADAKHLKLIPDRASVVAALLKDTTLEIPHWDFPGIHLKSNNFEELCKFYLTGNAINYCFFHQGTATEHRGQHFADSKLRGADLAWSRIVEHWSELKDPAFLKTVDAKYLTNTLFQAPIPIPMAEERAASLREIGEFLAKHQPSGGNLSFQQLFVDCSNDALQSAQEIATQLPLWNEPFLKRAQLFVGMVYGRFQNDAACPVTRESLSRLTVFADYRLPQTLIAMGIVQPDKELAEKLANRNEIISGASEELELRAATIAGADLLLKELNKLRPAEDQASTLHIDFLLWKAPRDFNKGIAPSGIFVIPMPEHHRTTTTDY